MHQRNKFLIGVGLLAFQLALLPISAQQVSFNTGKTRLKQIFDRIEQSTKYKFEYNSMFNVNRTVYLKQKKADALSIVSEVLKGTGYTYSLRGNYIVISRANTVQQQSETKPSEYTVKGTLTDAKGDPIIGASIFEKGTHNGTVTDVNGHYVLRVNNASSTLVVTYVGYETKELKASTANTTIILNDDNKSLDEVVVVGYGSVKKSNLTYSVSKIVSDNIEDRPLSTLSEAFQGQLAGVRAQAQNGVPGQELTIRIRGMNSINGDSSPLYVIDGVPRDNMSDLNSSDVASIQVLKDAAATSIYGSRGANGVILIETKQGKGKPTVNFDAYYGFNQPEKKLKLMNGYEWVAWNIFRRNEDYLVRGGNMSDPMSMRPASDRIPDNWLTANNFVDWQDEVLRTAPIQNYNVSASGQNDLGRIYMSVGYIDQQGIVIESNYRRMNLRLNSELNIYKNFRVGVNASMSNSVQNAADTNKGSNGNGKEAPLHHALMETPLMQLNEGTIEWGYPQNIGETYPNPVVAMKETVDKTKYLRAAASIYGIYDIMNGLQFKTQWSYNYDSNTYEYFVPANIAYPAGAKTNGRSTSASSRDWTIQNTLTYDNSFGQHHINVLLGQSAEKTQGYNIRAIATGWPYETISTLNVASTATDAKTWRSTYTTASFFGRLSYDFMDKYLFSTSVRHDGSSRFGSNSKWGTFPSVSAGWKINEESFMKSVDWINLLKIRIAYGKSGNDRIGDYAYYANLGTYNSSWNGTLVPGVAPSNIGNQDLKWEQTSSLDAGLDLSMFKNRLQINFDYYSNKTTNLLFNITTPLTTGFNSYLGNIGSLRNKGWELELTGHILSGPFKWTETVNFSHNTNKVLDMGEISKFVSEQWPDMFSITQVGEAIGQYYGYKTNGVLTADDFDADGKALVPIISGQREGNAKYVDISGPDGVPDGKITAADYTVLGSNMPNLMYGITTKLEWKNFDLSIFIQGQSGGKVCFLGSRQYDEGGMNYRVFSHWLNCYKPDYERLYGAGNDPIPYDYCKQHGIDMESWDGKTVNFRGNNQNRDDRRLYSATYWRLKNITLGYTFPRKYLEAMRFIKSLRLYASADNLYTHSNYPGFTPETNSFVNNTVFQGFDYSSYPLSRRVIFGVNVTF